jgi:hypothetical protein
MALAATNLSIPFPMSNDERKHLIVRPSTLDGTDKNGSVPMHATRVSL